MFEVLEKAKKLGRNQGELQRFAIDQAQRILIDAHAEEPITPKAVEKSPTLDLEKEWFKQAEKLAYLFAHPLGMSRPEYMFNCLPGKYSFTLPAPLKDLKEHFDIPLLVQTPNPDESLTLKNMLDIVEIKYQKYEEPIRIEDWKEDPGKFTTPAKPYTTFANDGSENFKVYAGTVLQKLQPNERGATILDGIALWLYKPEIFSNYAIVLPGSQRGGLVPYLFTRGPFYIEVSSTDYGPSTFSIESFASLTASRHIITRR